jgi:dienelactone hydrolase
MREDLVKAPQAILAVREATSRTAIRRLAALGAALAIAGTGSLLPASSAGSAELKPSEPAAASTAAAGRPDLPYALPGADRPTDLPVSTTVGLRVITFVDHTRVERFRGGTVKPRTLITQIRYPALGSADADDVRDAPPLTAAGPFPLVVFGHGFAETPTTYERLLDAWVRAGYVVAAPLFPLTQKHVPGGWRERDLINQPADMSFVISRMLAENDLSASFLHGLIAPDLIAVAGQSDGAATALAEAYDPAFADPRIRAAIILSGAELSSIDDSIPFPTQGPALLATQGSRDPINEPSATHRYFELAPRPKFLLTLIGATHLPPYTTQQRYLGVVEQVTIAFLDHYLLGEHDSLVRMRDAGNVPGIARLTG